MVTLRATNLANRFLWLKVTVILTGYSNTDVGKEISLTIELRLPIII